MSVQAAAITELAGCREASVRYGSGPSAVSALAGVELSVGSDEALVLLGRSGSGKSTLLHLLGGLITPSSGEVLWKGRPLSSLDIASRGRIRAEGIAYVFQGASLIPTFTAYENVSFAAWITQRAGIETRFDATELLGLVGLSEKLDALPAELSGGEAQRVAIARALVRSPDLLLCDEPTGHLDSDTAGRVLDLIDALRERLRFTLILATHDLAVGKRFPRSLTLVDGQIVAEPVT